MEISFLISPYRYITFPLHCLHCHPLLSYLLNVNSACGNYYGEFEGGMYVLLNLNRCLKVEDSGSPLSCNAVKVSLQIKKGLFDLPNIVFSPFRGWKWMVLSLISLRSLSFPIHTHTYMSTNTHAWCICSLFGSGRSSNIGYQGPKIQIIEHKRNA